MLKTVEWVGDHLRILDQTALPLTIGYCDCRDHIEVAEAIRTMKVRGAPAIGVAAAYGMYLGALGCAQNAAFLDHALEAGEAKIRFLAEMERAAADLISTRPTAVNLKWAVRRMMDRMTSLAVDPETSIEDIKAALLKEADQILREDIEMNLAIGQWGNELVPEKARILTHCNAGALATGGYGTALGIIRKAHETGKQVEVYADETRPLLQGARLTIWELMQEQIPATLVTDNMAGWLMRQGRIDMVIVGADRITANGDVANKIGTYGLAVLARAHDIPFYVAAPASTVDLTLDSGEQIPIEERHPDEVRRCGGIFIAPEGVNVYNPAFDVTPGRLISAIVTDRGIVRPPYLRELAAVMKN